MGASGVPLGHLLGTLGHLLGTSWLGFFKASVPDRIQIPSKRPFGSIWDRWGRGKRFDGIWARIWDIKVYRFQATCPREYSRYERQVKSTNVLPE